MNIFFICTGNTCRSPMAEAVLKSMKLPGVDVRSAGLYAGGGPISRNAATVLNGEGIEFDHQSRPVILEDLKWASLVLTMTKAHKKLLLDQYPMAADKTFTLKEYVDGSDGDVSDPYGGPEPVYRRTLEELKQLLSRLEKKLMEE